MHPYSLASPSNFTHKLVNLSTDNNLSPILRIPTLAIHLDRTVSSEGFKFNNEVQLTPILSAAVKNALNTQETNGTDSSLQKHHPLFLDMIAGELGVDVDQIADFELCLYDVQPVSNNGDFLFHDDHLNPPYFHSANSGWCST